MNNLTLCSSTVGIPRFEPAPLRSKVTYAAGHDQVDTAIERFFERSGNGRQLIINSGQWNSLLSTIPKTITQLGLFTPNSIDAIIHKSK